MGGSRDPVACGMLICLRFGHARYTQDSQFARAFARVSYPVAQAFVGSNPTPRTIHTSGILHARMHVGTGGWGRTMFSGPRRCQLRNVGRAGAASFGAMCERFSHVDSYAMSWRVVC